MISLFIVFLFVFGTLGRLIFIDRDVPDNEPYFGNLSDSIWTVLVVISSSSVPDQLVPGYTEDRITMIYFALFITLGSFVFMRFLFIAIFASFESNRKLIELQNQIIRIDLLHSAFHTMDIHKIGYLTFPQVNEVLEEFYTYYSGFKKSGSTTNHERALLLRALDRNGNGQIFYDEFLMILDLTRIEVHEEIQGHFLNFFFPAIVKTTFFIELFQNLNSIHIQILIDSIILLFSVVIILIAGITQRESSSLVNIFEMMLLLFIFVEVIVKITVIGPRRILTVNRLKYDALIGALVLIFRLLSSCLIEDTFKILCRYLFSTFSLLQLIFQKDIIVVQSLFYY